MKNRFIEEYVVSWRDKNGDFCSQSYYLLYNALNKTNILRLDNLTILDFVKGYVNDSDTN